MKIALVHDDLIQHGGAERVFEAMAEIWPGAPIYTSLATRSWQRKFQSRVLKTSFMQWLPLKEKLFRAYLPFYNLAFSGFDFSGFETILSSSTRFAHTIRTTPPTVHICYMNNPGRMFWESSDYFRDRPRVGKVLTPFLSRQRLRDYQAAQHVNYFLANSQSVQRKIKKYFHRDSEVLYPFVELERFNQPSHDSSFTTRPAPLRLAGARQVHDSDYYLVVSRLVSWKRVDIVVAACNQLRLPLVVVGEGPDRGRLTKMAGPTVKFLGRLSDSDVVDCYRNSRAFIFPQREDFGITPLEAMAAGKPVLAYRAGGALETVVAGETGEFFAPQTAEGLVAALQHFRPESYTPEVCRAQATRFSREAFINNLRRFVETAVATTKP